ncbi:hypothetical protein MNBD_ALPHA01-2117 [hydrothermal vent metagenome]|uniref:Uncharacterized protein n=1 Tax=hydrothermal vent metagenome TaxID=652676 RepID=A0A3B0RAC0_9ZZZZ
MTFFDRLTRKKTSQQLDPKALPLTAQHMRRIRRSRRMASCLNI